MSVLKEYRTVREVAGPLMTVDQVSGVHYNELIEIKLHNDKVRRRQVLEVQKDKAMIQLFEGSSGINLEKTKTRLIEHPLELPVSEDMVGHTFNGMGKPIGGGPDLTLERYLGVDDQAISPAVRDYPDEFTQTGISAIDHLSASVRGQKLSIFSGSGLPHNELAVQIARQATILNPDENFAIVFAAAGITLEETEFFMDGSRQTGTIDRSVLFINLTNGPAIERITIPHIVLTTAGYLVYEKDIHMLVIMTDMTNYCGAFREVPVTRREVPGCRGYSGYPYTNLSTLCERAGRLVGKRGSVAQIPIPTIPEDDITHLTLGSTGYTAERQIILSHGSYNSGYRSPINVLPSLSRLKDKRSGEDKTRGNHVATMNQLPTVYAQEKQTVELAVVLGESALSGTDKLYMGFIRRFGEKYINQGFQANRSVEGTLDLGWESLSILPRTEPRRIKNDMLDQYLPQTKTNDK